MQKRKPIKGASLPVNLKIVDNNLNDDICCHENRKHVTVCDSIDTSGVGDAWVNNPLPNIPCSRFVSWEQLPCELVSPNSSN